MKYYSALLLKSVVCLVIVGMLQGTPNKFSLVRSSNETFHCSLGDGTFSELKLNQVYCQEQGKRASIAVIERLGGKFNGINSCKKDTILRLLQPSVTPEERKRCYKEYIEECQQRELLDENCEVTHICFLMQIFCSNNHYNYYQVNKWGAFTLDYQQGSVSTIILEKDTSLPPRPLVPSLPSPTKKCPGIFSFSSY